MTGKEQSHQDRFIEVHEIEIVYQQIVSNLKAGVVLHVYDRLLYANPAAIQIFGVNSEKELVQYSLMDFIPRENQLSVSEAIEQLQHADVEIRSLGLQLMKMDGTRIDVKITSTTLFQNGTKMIQTIVQDVTHQKRLQEMERMRQEWMIFRNVVKYLADKIVNPLAVIEGFLGLLKEGRRGVPIDLLMDELESVHRIWQKLISVSQHEDKIGEVSPLGMLSRDEVENFPDC